MNILIIFLTMILCSCGADFTAIAPSSNPPSTPVVTFPPPGFVEQGEILTLVHDFNEERSLLGQDPIQPGLQCVLYTIPTMPATPCLSTSTGVSGCTQVSTTSGYKEVTSFEYDGGFNQPNVSGANGFNLLPQPFQTDYKYNFAVTCTGFFVNTDYAYHTFSTTSDDGSLLYINGLQVNNDGEHAVRTVVGAPVNLESAVYSFTLEYLQVSEEVALIVTEDGNLLNSMQLYH